MIVMPVMLGVRSSENPDARGGSGFVKLTVAKVKL